MARHPLRHGGQADRLRQAVRGAHARPGDRADGVHRRRRGRARLAPGGRLHRHHPARGHQRRPSAAGAARRRRHGGSRAAAGRGDARVRPAPGQSYERLKVAVLGGTRFIGRAAVEELAGAGHELLLIHRGESEPDGLPEAQHLHTDRADLARHRETIAEFGPDAALDCRALTTADAEVAVAALPPDIRLVVLSSIDVYRAFGALNQGRETDPVPIDEYSPVRTERYPYRDLMPGREEYDKLDVEDVYLPLGATSLRLPMVYGERDYHGLKDYSRRT